MDKHKHEECRAAKYSSIHATQIIRRAVATHRWRKCNVLASTTPHARTAARKYM